MARYTDNNMKHESIYIRIHRVLTWRRIIAFNVLLLLVLVIPLSLRLAQEDTENRSSAEELTEIPPPAPPENYPVAAPRLDRVTLFYGKPGDTVVLLGSNMGDYPWNSQVYVGNAEVSADEIVRWNDSVVEVQIPKSARTGNVWIVVNGNTASWDGILMLYDTTSSSRVGLTSTGGASREFWIEQNRTRVEQGTVDVGYSLGSIVASGAPGVTITSQTTGADSYGSFLRISFVIDQSLTSSRAPILLLTNSGGKIELIRVDLRDTSGNIQNVYVNPLDISVN